MSEVKGRSIRFGFLKGGLLGLGYYICDAFGAYLAVPELLDPTLDTLALLTLGALHVMFWSGLLGLVLTLCLSERLKSRLWSKQLGVLAGIVLIGLGFGFRVDRATLSQAKVNGKAQSAPTLFILVDTLRADTLYGDGLDFPLTPQFSKQAADAQIFTDAESTAGWTIPSLGALLSGVHNLSFDGSAGRVPSDIPLLPRICKRRAMPVTPL